MKIPMLQTFYAFMARLSKKEKIIFYAAIFFVSLALLDCLIVSPVHSKIKSLDEKIKEKESGVKKKLHISARKDKIASEIIHYDSFLSSAKSEEEEMTSLLKEIESLANKTSVYLVDMKPAGLKDKGEFRRYSINLNCEAQMEQLIDFMYNIENSNKLFSIEKYQIGPKSKESSIVKCSMSVVRVVIP